MKNHEKSWKIMKKFWDTVLMSLPRWSNHREMFCSARKIVFGDFVRIWRRVLIFCTFRDPAGSHLAIAKRLWKLALMIFHDFSCFFKFFHVFSWVFMVLNIFEVVWVLPCASERFWTLLDAAGRCLTLLKAFEREICMVIMVLPLHGQGILGRNQLKKKIDFFRKNRKINS